MKIEIQPACQDKEEICALFSEYTDMLIAQDTVVAYYLRLQNYEEELEHLEEKYGLPDGRLYIVKADGLTAGCIGLRKLDDIRCEMKRLYVRPAFRGHKLSEYLIKTVIDDAKEIGYRFLLLDTLPFLESAIHLYKKFGFHEISSYNNSPVETTIFMQLDLEQ